MNRIKLKLQSLLKLGLSFFSKRKNSDLVADNPILNAEADQKLVFNLQKPGNAKKLPSLEQLITLPKLLNPREKKLVKSLSGIIMISFLVLAINFYYIHSVVVADEGGSYTEGLVGTPQYINPVLASYNDIDRDLTTLIFNGLLKTNEDGVLVPDLAEEFQISPDHKTFTFKLKENVRWHDNVPLTANDVIFTVASIQDPEWQSQLKSALDNVQVEKLGDYSLRFVLKESNVNFINSLTFGILPEHLWLTVPSANATLAELNKKPVGTGPYKFKSLTKDKNGNIRNITLVRNEDYYQQKPYINELHFKFYGDFQSATDALANNNIEGLSLLPKEFQSAVKNDSSLKFYSLSLPQYTAVFYNLQKNEALKEKEVRQALAYGIDRQAILNESLDQKGVIIHGPILPGFIGFNPDLKKYSYDPTLASELLSGAGWKKNDEGLLVKNDQPLQITLTTVEKVEYVKAAELIKDQWQALGISAQIEIISKERIKPDIIEPRNYEALLFGQIIKADPYPFWHSSQTQSPGANLSIWASKDVDKLLEEARTLTDVKMINEKYLEFQNILTEYMPAIFLYNPTHTYPVNEKIKGITTKRISTPSDRFSNITQWYIKTDRQFFWSKEK